MKHPVEKAIAALVPLTPDERQLAVRLAASHDANGGKMKRGRRKGKPRRESVRKAVTKAARGKRAVDVSTGQDKQPAPTRTKLLSKAEPTKATTTRVTKAPHGLKAAASRMRAKPTEDEAEDDE